MTSDSATLITPQQLLDHWQGHRRLTRRVIEAFPEEHLFSYSVGGMRPFGVLALEMVAMGAPMLQGFVTEDWGSYTEPQASNREELLRLWDDATEKIGTLLPRLPIELFQETKTAFGQYTSRVYDLILYVVDNEVHHRGQGYVYLRALGIEPPPFYVRD